MRKGCKPKYKSQYEKFLDKKSPDSRELRYCEELAKGSTKRAAYIVAYGNEKGLTERTIERRIAKLTERERERSTVAACQSRFQEYVGHHYDGLKEYLIETMLKGIKHAAESSPAEIVKCVPLIKQISVMMGYENHELTIRNGGLSPDYNPPKNILTMTDEQLAKIIEGEATDVPHGEKKAQIEHTPEEIALANGLEETTDETYEAEEEGDAGQEPTDPGL